MIKPRDVVPKRGAAVAVPRRKYEKDDGWGGRGGVGVVDGAVRGGVRRRGGRRRLCEGVRRRAIGGREDLSKAVEMKRYGDAFFEQNSIAVLFGLCSGAGDLDAKYSIVGDALTVELNGSDELRQRQYCVVLELTKQESSAVKTLSVAKNAPQALAELKTSARQDRLEKFVLPEHADATIEDVTLAPFLGVFDGAVAAVFYHGQYHGVWPDVLEETTIGDVTFSWPAGYPIEVWKDGEICELSEAYEKDIVTDDDLKEIFGNYTLL